VEDHVHWDWRFGRNRVAVEETFFSLTQGSSFLATLGFEPQSLWD